VPHYHVVGSGEPERDLNDYVDRYDACILYADGLLDALLARLDLDRTVVVVLSDHGETLGERYWTLDHGGQAFDEQIRIPLVVSAPGLAPRRATPLAETVDLVPTLLGLLGVPLPPERPVQGRDLGPVLRGEPAPEREMTFASARAVSERHADRGYELDGRYRIHSLRTRRWKLIIYPGMGRTYAELYDLEADPGETADVSRRFPKVRDGLLDVLVEWMKGTEPVAPRGALDPQTRAKFEALGYLGDG
jgi:arylsulfatase A-like enzyme